MSSVLPSIGNSSLQVKEFKSRTFRFYDPLNENTFVESKFNLNRMIAPSGYFPAGNLATLSFPQTKILPFASEEISWFVPGTKAI